MKFKAILNDKYDIDNREKFTLKPRHKTLVYFLVIAAAVNILAVIYITRSNYIYFWDDSTYWDISRKIASGAFSEGGFWRNVYNSVAEQDYNYIAGLPSAAVNKLFGESRLVYVLGLVNMYFMPIVMLTYLLAKKVSKAPKIAAAITMLLCPSVMFLAFAGFVDIGGTVMCLICFNLYYTKKNKSGGIWRYMLIGILLAAMILWRRWYAFFAVSFITAMLSDCVLFRKKWYNAAVTVVFAAAVLLLFFRDFVFGKLIADYGNMYSGYKFSPGTDFKLIMRYFGLIFTGLLAVCSVVTGIRKKETRTVFMWIQIFVCLFMFMSTQTHGQQHLLLYIPSIIMLTLIMIKYISKEWMLAGIFLLAAAHTVNVYIPRIQPTNIQDITHAALIPDFSILPMHRSDTDEILALKRKLDTTVYEGDTMGVLASSFALNEDILKNAEPSLGEKPIRDNYIVSLPQVDSRDRDLSNLYKVNYILAAFPAQTHLADGSQTVVEEAVKSFEEGTDIASAYEEIPECETVINGVTLKLFHRVRDEYKKDIDAFEARLYK